MQKYIGSPTSRVDGIAKVTGAAKYAAEFNVPGLAHANLVCATIAKGRITRIDTAAAIGVNGVLTVLTHENRPPLADNDQAYKDDVAPDGSPYRPLYDGKILFDGQPVALVVAETSEVARYAASLVQVEYEKAAARHRHIPRAQCGRAGQNPDQPDGGRVQPTQAARQPGAGAGRRRRAPRGRVLRADRAPQSRWSSMPRR